MPFTRVGEAAQRAATKELVSFKEWLQVYKVFVLGFSKFAIWGYTLLVGFLLRDNNQDVESI